MDLELSLLPNELMDRKLFSLSALSNPPFKTAKSQISISRIRKELKIRPGFTPEEDIDRYRSTRQLQANARSATKPGIPGLATANVKLTAALAGLSKSQKVREKRKEKNKVELEEIEVFEEEEGVAVVEVRESWESDEEVEKVVEKVVEPEVVEPKKSLKSLIKKLRQVSTQVLG